MQEAYRSEPKVYICTWFKRFLFFKYISFPLTVKKRRFCNRRLPMSIFLFILHFLRYHPADNPELHILHSKWSSYFMKGQELLHLAPGIQNVTVELHQLPPEFKMQL